ALQGDTTSLQGNITDNASLIFNQGADGTFSGIVSGTGSLTKLGAGTLTLGGVNNYSGGTTISAGALQGDTTSLQGNIADNASLIFNQGSDGVFDGSLSGSGALLKSGSGNLIFNGVNPFSGAATVSAGTLIVGDNSHPNATLAGTVTVNSGATMGGIGTIGALDLSGTVVPGNTTGTLSVTGNAVFRNGSSYQVGATPAGQGSLIAIGGNASILGGSVLVLAQPGSYAPRTNYTILTAAQGVTGQFGAVSTNLTFLTPVLSYTANAVDLSLQRNDTSFESVAQTPNQKNTAGALDHLDPSSPVYDALLDLDAPTARHAFDQLSGEIHASTRTAIADNDDYVRNAINAHLAGQSNNANGLNVTDDHGVAAWATVWGHWGNHDGDGNASNLSVDGSGFLVGADLPVGMARLGAAMSTGQGTARVTALGSSSHIVDQHLGVYGSLQTGTLQWQGGAIYGWQKVDTNRFIDFGTFHGTAVSSYHAHTAQAYVDASLPFVHGGTTLAPFANLAVGRLSTPAVQESGTPAALAVASQDSTLGYGTLGLRATFDLGAPSHGLHAHASLGWQHAWGDTLSVDTMRFESSSDSFAVAGLPVLRNAGVVNTGISFTIAPGVSVDASYQGQFGQHAKDQAARISLDWTF
ncbi:MAG TPA: autotransporter domain-containing protein, partial [Rhodanobacter sp.]|nr:autotransporter domain-containing protein [Rhodanobacter sp.]